MRLETAPCVRCERPTVPRPVWRRWMRELHGVHPTYGRGLCPRCRSWAAANDELWRFERRFQSRDDVLDEWARLREDGYTYRDAAPRIGLSHYALLRALNRARAAGDPRAGYQLVNAKGHQVNQETGQPL